MIRLQSGLLLRTLLHRTIHKYTSAALLPLLDDHLVDYSVERTNNSNTQLNQFSSYTTRGPSLFPYVVVAVRSLNWDVICQLKFADAVKEYGFSHAFESFVMLIRIFSSVRMHRKVGCLLRDVVIFNKEENVDSFELLSELVHLSNGSITLLQASGDVIKALADDSMFNDAREHCLEAMRIGLKIGVPLYNFLLKCFVESYEVGDVRRDHMKVSGPSPNVYTYTIMMDWYTKGDALDVDKANKILFEMENNGFTPNAVTHGMYLRGLCMAGNVQSAWEFLRNLQHKGLQYGNYCCNVVIHGFCCDQRKHLLSWMR